jgi:tRNA (guanine-N7-)-methyltransferase
MKIPSSPNAAPESSLENERAFRADLIPAPTDRDAREAGMKLAQALVEGGPVDLEIGCGVGWHPIRYAGENPKRTVVAIERTAEKFAKFRDRLGAHPAMPNLIPVHADAVAWITHFAPDKAFERILILYPNPNPKNASARWIRMPFFGHLLRKLRPGGQIEIRTNIATYADEVRESAAKWGLGVFADRAFGRADVAARAERTHFERKYLERGETCFAITLSRRETLR